MNATGIERKHFERVVFSLFILSGIVGLVRVLLTQDLVWVSNGLGWDGSHYNLLLRYFSESQAITERAGFPFCGRIGTAWILSALFHGKVSFYEFNIVVSATFSIVFIAATSPLWRGSIKALSAAIALSSFLFFAPIKLTSFYPMYMDPPFMLILAITLFFIIRSKYNIAAVLCIFAIPFREAAFYLIPLLVAFAFITKKNRSKAAFIGLLAIAVGYAVKSHMLNVAGCEAQSQAMTAFWGLYRLLTDPMKALGALAALSLTLGPLLFLHGQNELTSNRSFEKVQAFSIVAALYTGALSVVAGTDVTRIFYSFLPLYAPVLILAFSNFSLSGFALACFGWLLTNQMLGKYEQPATEMPNNDLTGFFAQFPDHAHPVVAVGILLTWLILRASCGYLHDAETWFFDRFLKERTI